MSGGTPDTTNESYWGNEVMWFTPSEIGKTKFVYESKRTISRLGLNKSSAKLLPCNSILLSSRATVGELSINTNECATNQGFQSLIPKLESNLNFLYYNVGYNKHKLIRKASGSTFLEINRTDVGLTKLKTYSVAKNQLIGTTLSSIDNLINQQNKKIQTLMEHDKYLAQLFFSVFPFDKLVLLQDVGKIITGKTPSTKNLDSWGGSIPFITPTDMIDKRFITTSRSVNLNKIPNSLLLPANTICFTCIASIGKMAMTDKLSITNQQINSIACNMNYNPEYIYYQLRWMKSRIKSMVSSDGMAMISKSEFSKIKIQSVPINEQNKIANILSQMDKLIELDLQ